MAEELWVKRWYRRGPLQGQTQAPDMPNYYQAANKTDKASTIAKDSAFEVQGNCILTSFKLARYACLTSTVAL